MDFAPLGKGLEGKREAEDAIERESVTAKKQKVEENATEIKADMCCSLPDQLIEVRTSGIDDHVISAFEDKSNFLEHDEGTSEKKHVVASNEGCIAAACEIDEPNGNAESCPQDKICLDEDITADIEAPASLIKEDLAALPKKKDESSMVFVSSSDDAAFLDDDVTAGNLSPPVLSINKSSSVSIQKKDDFKTHEFETSHETSNDDNVDICKNDPKGSTEKSPVVSWEVKDESCSDNVSPNKVTAESTSPNFAKKEDETNKELELDDGTNSSDDDDDRQIPASPTEQMVGSKILYVGNLSYSIWREDIEDFFKEAGEIVNIRFAMNSDETFKGYGYVEFASADAALKAACELNGKELLRRPVKLHFANERRPCTSLTGRQDRESFQNGGKALGQGQTVFVRGFDNSGCLDEIRRSLEEHFGSCGEISKVSIPKDQDGSARGIAYIEFKERDAFIRALALHGSEFREGIILKVKEARPRDDNHDSACNSRDWGIYNWQEFGRRSDPCYFPGRGGLSDFHERGGLSVFRGRSGPCDFRGRSGPSYFRGRSGPSVFRGRSSPYDSSGRSSSSSDFRGGSGLSGVHESRWSDFGGRGGWSNVHGRSGWSDLRGRSGPSEFRGRSGWSDFCRNGQPYFCGRSGWPDFRGRSSYSDFRGRGGIHEGVAWSGTGAWRGSNGRGVWRGRGVSANYNARNCVGGTGVWLGGGGRGQGDIVKPSFVDPGNGTTTNSEGQMEDQMK